MTQPNSNSNSTHHVSEAIDLTARATSLLEGAAEHVITEVAAQAVSDDPARAAALLTLSSQLLDAAALCRALTQSGNQIARALNAPAGARARLRTSNPLRAAAPSGILTPDESVTNPVDKAVVSPRNWHHARDDLRSADLGY